MCSLENRTKGLGFEAFSYPIPFVRFSREHIGSPGFDFRSELFHFNLQISFLFGDRVQQDRLSDTKLKRVSESTSAQ